jgi:peroxiredoxin
MKRDSRRNKVATLTTIVFAVLTSLSAYGQKDVHAVLVPQVNRKPAPAFRLVDANGKTVQTSDYRGKVVLLNFWATSCGGCILEIPSFIELQGTYGKSGFTAVGISADIPYEGLKSADEAWRRVHPFISSHGLNYPILMGDNTVISDYGFRSYPSTYLIDKSGKIAATYVGIVDKKDVETNIKTLLAQH